MWKKFDATQIKGDLVEGDEESPPTTWYNILWLKFFGWKKLAVYRVVARDAERGYRVGYKAQDGTCRLLTKALHDGDFAVRVGHEACTFFAVDPDGKEIWLRFDHVTRMDEDFKRRGIRLI